MTVQSELLSSPGEIATSVRWSEAILNWSDRWRKSLFGLLLLSYLLGFNGRWQMEPDSAMYLTVARSLARGDGYLYHGLRPGHAYPGLPYMLAGLFKIFGNHALIFADIMILFFGLATIALTYRLVFLAFDRRTAVMVSLGLGICYEFYRYCYEIMTDVPFVCGIMAALAGHQAIFHRKPGRRVRWWDWALLLGGLAITVTTRPTMIGFVAAWIVAMSYSVLRSKKARLMFCVTVVVSILLLVLFVSLDPRSALTNNPGGSYERFAWESVTSNLASRLHHEIPANIKDLFGLNGVRAGFGMPLGNAWVNAFFGSAILISGLLLWSAEPLWGAWVGITLAMLILFVSHDRYMLEILPLLVLGWWRTMRWLNLRLRLPTANWIFAGLLGLGITLNCGKIGGTIFNQHRIDFYGYYKEGRMPAYQKLAKRLTQVVTPQDNVLADVKVASILTYFSDRRVLNNMEDTTPLPGGRTFIVWDPDPIYQDFYDWVSEQHIARDGDPVISIDRSPGKPLLLFRVK